MMLGSFRGSLLPVVFVHGLGGMSSVDYGVLIGDALTGHPAILVDLPGTGRPFDPGCDVSIEGLARYVGGVLDSNNVSRAVLFGHSMGGSVVMSLAGLRPDLVAGVILTESNLDPGGGMWSCRITSMSEDEFVASGYQELIDEQKRQCPSWAHTLSLSSPVALYREARSLVAGTVPTWREILYGLQCPRFYVFGDKTLPNADVEELPRHGVKVRVVERAGHNMVYDNPEGFARMLVAAWSRCLDPA